MHVGVAEGQVSSSSREHPEAGGADEQPHSLGGYNHTLAKGKSCDAYHVIYMHVHDVHAARLLCLGDGGRGLIILQLELAGSLLASATSEYM